MTSSIYPLPATLNTDPGLGTDILQNPIVISPPLVKPGGGGILRLYFAFTFGATPATITIFNNGVAKGNLNADNDAQVVTDGYYRFDIDVQSVGGVNDSINIRADQNITSATSFFRAHLVQFGS